MNIEEVETAVKARFDDLDNEVIIDVDEFYSDHNNEDRFRIAVTVGGMRTTYEVPINADDLAVENTIDAIDSAVRSLQ